MQPEKNLLEKELDQVVRDWKSLRWLKFRWYHAAHLTHSGKNVAMELKVQSIKNVLFRQNFYEYRNIHPLLLLGARWSHIY